VSARDGLYRLGWQAWYQLLGLYSARAGARFTVMNWGYDDGRVLVDEHEAERWPLQLYARVVEGVAVEGRVVVDVSCGRGGGLAWLARARGARGQGVDFTPQNIKLCRQAFGHTETSWTRGSALALPMPNASVDVVISVEASHCYQRVDTFLDEAARVVAEDGVVCWTDFAPRDVAARQLAWCHQRFAEVVDVDVTAAVLAAMKRDAARRKKLIRDHSLRALWPVFDNFAAADDDADTVRRFVDGRSVYFLRQLRRPR
jgi:ubiquinone/menaquinone biosynthesis C-methylase UbiE